ncbi:nitrate reductase associated protein [Cytophagaceae bacterium YF14B1]|uniref:Nitrate reductase associated protein n=1 Tax=Xanthocytophaga flava TaxID=3048013 RepID=A0AAE3QLC5_9BACT|nr:nitrate reductase associated protein [Xanthocytophaga flavus]MDJ1479215.1 nitrate reductase associated protein [Xanthocytophaga flavus]
MNDYFRFEADFIESMRCIPMGVRCKLDTCGIKLKLSEWSDFTKEERDQLFELPCFEENDIQAYREYLQKLVQKYTQSLPDDLVVETRPAWLDSTQVPESLQEKAEALHVQISLDQWRALTPLQRFALIKLSKPSHESKNFPHALREFGFLF